MHSLLLIRSSAFVKNVSDVAPDSAVGNTVREAQLPRTGRGWLLLHSFPKKQPCSKSPHQLPSQLCFVKAMSTARPGRVAQGKAW